MLRITRLFYVYFFPIDLISKSNNTQKNYLFFQLLLTSLTLTKFKTIKTFFLALNTLYYTF